MPLADILHLCLEPIHNMYILGIILAFIFGGLVGVTGMATLVAGRHSEKD